MLYGSVYFGQFCWAFRKKERNSRPFNNKEASPFNLWDKILFWITTWIKSNKDFKFISFFDLFMG